MKNQAEAKKAQAMEHLERAYQELLSAAAIMAESGELGMAYDIRQSAGFVAGDQKALEELRRRGRTAGWGQSAVAPGEDLPM